MSRKPIPSIFDADSMSVDDLKAKTLKQQTHEPPRRAGRPAKNGTKPISTPFYIHPAVKEVLREIAYHERCKEHDLFVEGLEHVLKRRSYGSIAKIIEDAEKS